MRYEIVLRIYQGCVQFLNILSIILIIYGLMTWIVRPNTTIYKLFNRFCEPLLSPFRRISRKLIQKGLMIDISIPLCILAIQLLEQILARLVRFLI